LKPSMLAVSLAAALLAGCADANVTTIVKADGAWARTLEFRTDAQSPTGEKGNLGKIFDLPKGEGWKSAETVQGKKMVFSAEQTGKAGDARIADLVVKTKKGAVALSNEATIREISPGRFEYREVLRWKLQKPKDYLTPDPGQIAVVKAALPADLADDAKVVELLQAAQRGMYRRLLGPGDPLVAQLLLHPRLGVRRLKKDLQENLSATMKDMFGDKIGEAQRAEIARKIVAVLDVENVQEKAQPKPPGAPAEGGAEAAKDEAEFVPLAFTLKVPGKIISANGEIDRAAGEIFWAFYAQSAELEDVVLTATFESKP
jgi:hypothetical protein